MEKILLVVMIDTHFVELLRVARLLKDSRKYEPLIWFQFFYPTIERDIQICQTEGFGFSYSPPRPSRAATRRDWFYKPITRYISNTFEKYFGILFLGRDVVINLIRNRNLELAFIALLEKYRPRLMIFAEDNVGYLTHIFIQSGNKRGVPSIIIPYTMANATEAAEYYFDYPKIMVSKSLINRFTGRLFPRWVYTYRGRRLLRLPPEFIFAIELSGFRYARPWTMNSEVSTIIAVENEHMLEYYRKEDMPDKRLVMTGALYDDVLLEATEGTRTKRLKLIEEMGLPNDPPLLLCAIPPNQFPRPGEFDNYIAMLEFWMQSLSSVRGWNVVVRPHPRMTTEEVEAIKYSGVRITTNDTASLVPLCDLYLASVSATIRWAIACGIPVINYDVYRMGYKDYVEVKGVLTLDNREDFAHALRRITTDRDYYDQIATAQKKEMKRWGRLDGKSGERMLQLFDDVIAGKYKEKLT